MTTDLDSILLPRKGDVHAKIRKVCDECGNMQKDGTNVYANYKFASYDGALSTLRPVLSKYGLRLRFTEIERSVSDTKTTKGKDALGALSVMRLFVIDIETGEFDCTDASNYSTDTADKALAQANTGAKKYALFSMFEISTSGGENAANADGDQYRGDSQEQQPIARAQSRPAAKSASASERPPADANEPAPAPMLANIARLIERIAASGADITPERVIQRHAAGKSLTAGDPNVVNRAQGVAIHNALAKFEKSHRARTAA